MPDLPTKPDPAPLDYARARGPRRISSTAMWGAGFLCTAVGIPLSIIGWVFLIVEGRQFEENLFMAGVGGCLWWTGARLRRASYR